MWPTPQPNIIKDSKGQRKILGLNSLTISVVGIKVKINFETKFKMYDLEMILKKYRVSVV